MLNSGFKVRVTFLDKPNVFNKLHPERLLLILNGSGSFENRLKLTPKTSMFWKTTSSSKQTKLVLRKIFEQGRSWNKQSCC